MEKNFIGSAIVTIVITAFIGLGQYTKENRRQESYKQYEQEKEEKANQRETWWADNSSQVNAVDSSMQLCLSQFSPTEVRYKNSTNDIIREFITHRMQYLQDSTERSALSDEEKALASNRKNTLVLSWREDASEQDELFGFANIMTRMYGKPENVGYNPPQYQYSVVNRSILQSSSQVDFKDLNYLILLHDTLKVNPTVAGEGSFEGGAIVTKYSVYDVNTSKNIKNGLIVATNSEELGRVPSGMASMYLNSDLVKNSKKEIDKTLFGAKNYRLR